MTRLCQRCDVEISPRRLVAMPFTRICLACKTLSDESPLTSGSVRLRGVLVTNSLSDGDEMSREARQLGEGD